MMDADLCEPAGWPQPMSAGLDRDPALAALEEAWRAGLLVENEPSA
jgi:hypothetical protein